MISLNTKMAVLDTVQNNEVSIHSNFFYSEVSNEKSEADEPKYTLYLSFSSFFIIVSS